MRPDQVRVDPEQVGQANALVEQRLVLDELAEEVSTNVAEIIDREEALAKWRPGELEALVDDFGGELARSLGLADLDQPLTPDLRREIIEQLESGPEPLLYFPDVASSLDLAQRPTGLSNRAEERVAGTTVSGSAEHSSP